MYIKQNPLVAITVLAFAIVPPIIIWWSLPRVLNSKRSIKMLIGSVIVLIYTVTVVSLVDRSDLQIQNIKFVVTLTALIWGFVGFIAGTYFDLGLRIKLGAKYHQEFLRLRMYGVEFGVVGTVISLPLGILVGWVVVVLGASFLGLLLSAIIGVIFGGVLGRILDQLSRSSKT
jgi:hypothetical protein